MNFFKNPDWVIKLKLPFSSIAEISEEYINEVNTAIKKLEGNQFPVVSLVIPVWNEEMHIIPTITSLSRNQTEYPTELIVVNNNSTDHTHEVLELFDLKVFNQPIQGCGPARQLGMERARGKYVLMADSDCIYPENWIQEMIDKLRPEGVVCVYARHSFIATSRRQRLGFSLHELLRDVLISIRHNRRPYLNALGMYMAYKKEYGIKIRFDQRNVRGEDGRFCFDLMKYGKVVKLPRSIRVWTPPRTLQKERNLILSLLFRVFKEMSRIFENFYRGKDHDTHKSDNYIPIYKKRNKNKM